MRRRKKKKKMKNTGKDKKGRKGGRRRTVTIERVGTACEERCLSSHFMHPSNI